MKIKNVVLFLLCVLIGLLITIQSRVITGSFLYVSHKTIQDYKLSIESQTIENEKIEASIKDKEEQLGQYQSLPGESEKLLLSMNKELLGLKLISGVTDVYGDGIIIVLDDGTRELYPGEDPLDIIVHDMDILKIINDLRIAGAGSHIYKWAENYQHNGDKLFWAISIRINNQFFAQPFIIKAIGNPNMLEASIMSPDGYGELLLTYGLIVEVDKVINMTIEKYADSIDYKYLKQAEEGEIT